MQAEVNRLPLTCCTVLYCDVLYCDVLRCSIVTLAVPYCSSRCIEVIKSGVEVYTFGERAIVKAPNESYLFYRHMSGTATPPCSGGLHDSIGCTTTDGSIISYYKLVLHQLTQHAPLFTTQSPILEPIWAPKKQITRLRRPLRF